MTSASFSIPDPLRPAGRSSRRSRSLDTATSAAADAAIRQIVDRRRSRNRYGSPRDSKTSMLSQAVDGVGDAINGSIQQMGLPQWAFKSVFVVLVAVVLGWAVFVRGAVSRHSVDGVLLFEGKPVASATVTFRLAGGSADRDRVFQTDAAGAFRTDADEALPAGLYTVVVVPPKPSGAAGRKPGIPAIYADPSTSPLRVQVSEDLSGLRLLVRR